MAEWKERGYVPDSDDDEEEEGFDLLSRDGSIEDSTPRPDETKERPSIDDSEESLVLDRLSYHARRVRPSQCHTIRKWLAKCGPTGGEQGERQCSEGEGNSEGCIARSILDDD
jgi:hypothetical protein